MKTKWIQKIRKEELNFEFVLATGKGGQNVNRVHSAAVLRWNPYQSKSLSLELREKIIKKLYKKISSSGDIIIRAEKSRHQLQNKKECLQRLDDLIANSLRITKVRKPTSVPSYAREKRLESKKRKSSIKKMRKVSWD